MKEINSYTDSYLKKLEAEIFSIGLLEYNITLFKDLITAKRRKIDLSLTPVAIYLSLFCNILDIYIL